MAFPLPCTLDLRTLTLKQLQRLNEEVHREAARRKVNVSSEDMTEGKKCRKYKEPVSTEYIHKWEAWTKTEPYREIKWSWHRKGKAWQMELSVTDEKGIPRRYTRWGKNKKATQKHLAKSAWYRYLNEESDTQSTVSTAVESTSSTVVSTIVDPENEKSVTSSDDSSGNSSDCSGE